MYLHVLQVALAVDIHKTVVRLRGVLVLTVAEAVVVSAVKKLLIVCTGDSRGAESLTMPLVIGLVGRYAFS